MKKSRFTEEQMVAILREADRGTVPEVARKSPAGAGLVLPSCKKRHVRRLSCIGNYGIVGEIIIRKTQTIDR